MKGEPTEITYDTFCEWLQHEMNRNNMTASQVARLSGLTPSSIRGLMQGRQFPTLFTMESIAAVFNRRIMIM